jgi:hypothetical protein
VAAASLPTERTAAGDGVNSTATVEVNPPPVPLPSVVSPPSAPNLTSLLTGHVGQDVGNRASSEIDIRFQDVEQVDDGIKSPKKKKSKNVKSSKEDTSAKRDRSGSSLRKSSFAKQPVAATSSAKDYKFERVFYEAGKKRGAVTQGRGGKTPPRLPPEESPYESSESGESSDGDEGNDGRMATREELLSMLRSKERTIKKLQAEVHSLRNKTRPNKSSLRSSNNWTAGEINFAEDVNTFVREFLFPRYKFLRYGWQNYLPDQQHSLSTLCLKKLALPEGSDKEDVWERVIVPSIQMKYINIKGNMNSDLKKNFMSMSCILFRHFR